MPVPVNHLLKSTANPAWHSMKMRCRNRPWDKSCKRWGGRGITYCDRWKEFEEFLKDMGPRPSRKYLLERIDNDGHYEPGNCKWATRTEQMRNTSSNFILTVRGVTASFAEICERFNVPYARTYYRIKQYGWSVEDALFRPVRCKLWESKKCKLDPDKVKAIRKARESGELMGSIATRFGVGFTTVHAVIHRNSWKHIF